MALSHVRVRLLVLAVVVAALGLAAGMVLPQPSSAQNVGGPPPNCGEDCEYAGEQYMNYTQCGTNHEGIAFKLERTGPDTFTALVCLYNYEGMPVACNRNSVCGYDGVGNHRFVPPGVDSKVWELVGPPGENIWKARWFICGGSGNVTLRGDPFCSDGCLGQTNCTAPANPVCEPDQCDEQFLNTVRRPPPLPPCAAPGFELVQVGIENECQYPQSIHYWWTYVRDGVERTDGPYAITLPGSSWTYLCLNTQLVQSVDGYVQLDGYVRGVNLCEPAIDSLTGWVNKVWCCDEDLNCTEVYDDPVVPDGSCSPPGGP